MNSNRNNIEMKNEESYCGIVKGRDGEMAKIFNVSGSCRPEIHYMVDLTSRLEGIKKMVDAGDYFVINRGRQYGKTTTLHALNEFLDKEYVVVSLDFQTLGEVSFENTQNFVAAFASEMLDALDFFPMEIEEKLTSFAEGTAPIMSLQALFRVIKTWCGNLDRMPVLIIDEVDYASNNQVFLDFLAQLRAYYLKRPNVSTFQSVILAGVYTFQASLNSCAYAQEALRATRYDIRSMKRKIRPEEAHKENSPWNIAAEFNVDMSFGTADIASMLEQYEKDYHTGMDINEISEMIYRYTFGYPVLVSRICKILDEKIAGTEDFPDKRSAWTMEGVLEAIKRVVKEDNPLYESMLGKLEIYPELKPLLKELLFNGRPIPYVATTSYIKDAAMFGFIRNENDTAVISNRIFEAVLYNSFISEEFSGNKLYSTAAQERNQFIVGGHLDIRKILEKFIETFGELYGEEDEEFLENVGRKYFLLFLKPIINGIGNYSIEPQTRDGGRMDMVIYYQGEQNILELKIWRGNAYNERGEEQLSAYLDFFHMKKGYMLSFNFNRKKTRGIREIVLGDRILIEGVV